MEHFFYALLQALFLLYLNRVVYEAETCYNQWYTENLSHVYEHSSFKAYLFHLDEFNEETEKEYSEYAESYIES